MTEQLIKEKEELIQKLQDEVTALRKRDLSPRRAGIADRMKEIKTELFGPDVQVFFGSDGKLTEPNCIRRCSCPRNKGCSEWTKEFSCEIEIYHGDKRILTLELGMAQENEQEDRGNDKFWYGIPGVYAFSCSTADYWKDKGWELKELNKKLGEFLAEQRWDRYEAVVVKEMAEDMKFLEAWDRELEDDDE
jgi:hypothetical protein